MKQDYRYQNIGIILGLPISGRVDGAFAPETVHSGLIPHQVNQRLKTIFPALLFDVQQQ